MINNVSVQQNYDTVAEEESSSKAGADSQQLLGLSHLPQQEILLENDKANNLLLSNLHGKTSKNALLSFPVIGEVLLHSSRKTNLMVISYSYPQQLSHPQSCLSLTRISPKEWEGESTGGSGLHVGFCTEICLQMHPHVQLLL